MLTWIPDIVDLTQVASADIVLDDVVDAVAEEDGVEVLARTVSIHGRIRYQDRDQHPEPDVIPERSFVGDRGSTYDKQLEPVSLMNRKTIAMSTTASPSATSTRPFTRAR